MENEKIDKYVRSLVEAMYGVKSSMMAIDNIEKESKKSAYLEDLKYSHQRERDLRAGAAALYHLGIIQSAMDTTPPNMETFDTHPIEDYKTAVNKLNEKYTDKSLVEVTLAFDKLVKWSIEV